MLTRWGWKRLGQRFPPIFLLIYISKLMKCIPVSVLSIWVIRGVWPFPLAFQVMKVSCRKLTKNGFYQVPLSIELENVETPYLVLGLYEPCLQGRQD